ncbi:10497_t:CDS:2 [Scutellospora calospora]|uniref:10497_t:CDS:1 n=1 Tax=Scutellospora calospora TaxID=85575 RepID=A0ACA9K1K2_9GLOM|nr:10497_t:CDS:2 [Scutellospora calospora]
MSLVNKKDWFKAAIDGSSVKSFEYNSISDIRIISSGTFGTVSRAYLKCSENIVALKTLHNSINNDENSFNEFVLISGERESPIKGTPIDFINIYSDAWNDNSNLRPTISELHHKLDTIQLEPIYGILQKCILLNYLSQSI